MPNMTEDEKLDKYQIEQAICKAFGLHDEPDSGVKHVTIELDADAWPVVTVTKRVFLVNAQALREATDVISTFELRPI